jgi:RecA/RadA recombinase
MDQLSKLLAACLGSRDACAIIAGARVVKDDVALRLIQEAVTYYERDAMAQWVDRAVLAGLIKAAAVHPKAVEGLLAMLEAVPPHGQVSAENVATMVHTAVQREARLRLAAACESGVGIREAMDRMRDLDRPAILSVHTQLDAAALLKATGDRTPIYPPKLNGVLAGGFAPGHCVIVFGRPGSGKTLVVCNLAAGFLLKGKVVLHIMNEESQEALTMRYLSLLCPHGEGRLENLAHSREDVRTDSVNKAMAFCMEKRNFANLHIAHGIYNYTAVRELVARLKPDMVIVDQERVTQDLRQHAHEAGFTGIGVTQAGASAEGKPVLDLADIDGAKTGLQGACDLIIGLGKGPTDEAEHKRVMSVCRNKISGVITHFPVYLDEQHTLIKNTL